MSKKNVSESLNVSWALRELIEKKVEDGSIKLDLAGHFHGKDRKPSDPFAIYDFGFRGGIFDIERLNELKTAVETGVPLKEPAKMPPSHSFQCFECSQKLGFDFDGTKFTCTNPCPYPKGMPAYDFFLNVPSGKMVVANDLREYFPIMGDYSVNYTEGCKKTAEKYATVGMAHAFVGNTCPGVYKVSDRKFVIGCATERKKPVKGVDVEDKLATIHIRSIDDIGGGTRTTTSKVKQGKHNRDATETKETNVVK